MLRREKLELWTVASALLREIPIFKWVSFSHGIRDVPADDSLGKADFPHLQMAGCEWSNNAFVMLRRVFSVTGRFPFYAPHTTFNLCWWFSPVVSHNAFFSH